MIARIGRLVRAEFIKLLAHPFFYIALGALAAAVLLAEHFYPIFREQRPTEWRNLHAVQLFAYGFRFSLWIATLVLLIFSSMMFAGEFDRGTVKNLLTRPITRTDFFVAKTLTTVLLASGLYLFVLGASLAYALARGDLGPVWDPEQYVIIREHAELMAHARKAVIMSFLPFLAAGFLGLLVSNWTESSGYAVAIALILYILGDLVTGWLGFEAKRQVFLSYPAYAIGKLQEYAEGATTRWNPDIDRGLLYVKVPLAYIAAFIPFAFSIFRFRNIHA